MQKWEYKRVRSGEVDVGDIIKHRKKEPVLDPHVANWMEHTWVKEIGTRKYDVARLCWLEERCCWTTTDILLEEYGEQGWELIAVTPHVRLTFWEVQEPPFDLIFKRPKP